MTVGLEQTDIPVTENAGNVSVCVRVLQPHDQNVPLGSDLFRIGIRTVQNMGPNGV